MILCIETTTQNCSVALVQEAQTVASTRMRSEHYVHAEQLHPLIAACLQQAQADWSEVKAIAVSSGPGSYTGLRIGVAAAKGLAFALHLPLIEVDTLHMLGNFGLQKSQVELAIAMIDARRMEIYASVVNSEGASAPQAVIVDREYFTAFASKSLVLIGDGAAKCAPLVDDTTLLMHDLPDATMMAELASKAWVKKEFVDLAYYEPRYLKEYMVGVSTKSVF